MAFAKTKIRRCLFPSVLTLWERTCPMTVTIQPPLGSISRISDSSAMTGRVSTAPESLGTSSSKRKNRLPWFSWEKTGRPQRLPRSVIWLTGYSIVPPQVQMYGTFYASERKTEQKQRIEKSACVSTGGGEIVRFTGPFPA